MAQRIQRKALPEHGSSLQHRPIRRRQAIHARQHQSLDRTRQRLRRHLVGIEQQLFEEERVAVGALDATQRQRLRHVGVLPGEPSHLLRRQRLQVQDVLNRHQRSARGLFASRRRHQQQTCTPGEFGQRRQSRHRPDIGPMHILDQQELRLHARRRTRQFDQHVLHAAVARRLVHGRGERTPFRAQFAIEQCGQEHLALVRQRCTRRHARQPARQRTDRIATALGAEVEHQRAVCDEAVPRCPFTEFRRQSRLADAGVAAHQDQSAMTTGQAIAGMMLEARHLVRTADQWTQRTRRRRPRGKDAPRHDGPLLAAYLRRHTGLTLELPLDFAPGVVADDDLVLAREVEQACRGIDHVAGQRELAVARVAAPRHDQPGVDAAVHGQHATDAWRDFGSDVAHFTMQVGGRTHRAHGVVAARGRNAEQRHDLVADKLVDDAAMARDHRGRDTLDPVHDHLDFLGIEAFV